MFLIARDLEISGDFSILGSTDVLTGPEANLDKGKCW